MKHVFKYPLSALLLASAVLLLPACSNGAAPQGSDTQAVTSAVTEERKQLSIGEIAQSLSATCSFSEPLSQNDLYLANHAFGFSALGDQLKAYTAYVPSGITPEEIFVFEAADDAGVKAIVDKLHAYVDYQASEYERYAPGQVAKLDSPVIVTHGKLVIYVISKDNAAALDAVNALF